jgi:hypothetical protein
VARLAAEPLESRTLPGVLAAAGGEVFELDAAGRVLARFRPFEFDAAGVPVSLSADDAAGLLYVGAGAGGGPRIDAFRLDDFARVWSVFVGDPASRTGVGVEAWARPAAPLRAESHPAAPGDPAAVQRDIDTMPRGVAAWLAAGGVRVEVYAPAAKLTDLPEFAALRGVPTGAGGDGGRTYDQADAAEWHLTAFLRADSPGPTRHELGHAAEELVADADWAEWVRVWRAIDWPTYPSGAVVTDYYRLNEGEAFAQSFALWTRGGASLPAAVRGYFDSLALRLEW